MSDSESNLSSSIKRSGHNMLDYYIDKRLPGGIIVGLFIMAYTQITYDQLLILALGFVLVFEFLNRIK